MLLIVSFDDGGAVIFSPVCRIIDEASLKPLKEAVSDAVGQMLSGTIFGAVR